MGIKLNIDLLYIYMYQYGKYDVDLINIEYIYENFKYIFMPIKKIYLKIIE